MSSTTSTTMRTSWRVCCREMERVSSGGAARKISWALYVPARGSSYQVMKAAMPACATRPIQERSSAARARYQSSSASRRLSAAEVSMSVPPRSRRTTSELPTLRSARSLVVMHARWWSWGGA
ncbi:hypothetical protein [Georgenia sp. SUBG003]|uniref:hypothetical protein n=1 Tax=Georgenia sp. SUBG003 TaxID=1497974 RepID=UPI003AB8955C